MSGPRYMKILKEKEKLLLDIEAKLEEQLKNLKKEEIFLRSILPKEKEEHADELTEDTVVERELDDDSINKAPLKHLNAASSSFYNMYTTGCQSVEANMTVDYVEEEDEKDEEEEEEEEDDGGDVFEGENNKMTEEEQRAEFQRLMSSMHDDG